MSIRKYHKDSIGVYDRVLQLTHEEIRKISWNEKDDTNNKK